jgi:hypothetical protein
MIICLGYAFRFSSSFIGMCFPKKMWKKVNIIKLNHLNKSQFPEIVMSHLIVCWVWWII